MSDLAVREINLTLAEPDSTVRLRPAGRFAAPLVGGAAVQPRWMRRHAVGTAAVDAGAMALALTFTGWWAPERAGLAAAALVGWSLSLALCGVYEVRAVAHGADEFRRVGRAVVAFLAGLAASSLVVERAEARDIVATVVPLAAATTLIARYGTRQWVHHLRSRGRCLRRVLAIGPAAEVEELVTHFRRASYAGFTVVGACSPAGEHRDFVADVPVYGGPTDVMTALSISGADAVAVTSGGAIGPDGLRRLAWSLEGTGIDLIVAPAVTDVAGPRIAVRPVCGVPLLHVEEPRLRGGTRVVNEITNRLAALAALVIIGPFLAAVAVLIRLTSSGPAFFRQQRIGRTGRPFTMWKFRTMVSDAEQQRADLADRNEHDGLLFKIRDDPRRTRLGRWLRRFSIDELPQLWNVVRGDMLLVGPRPPLPEEVAHYDGDLHRRLLVKPGLTGLWQVSGRADLSWDEAVRLDLYYVENWSPFLDLMILWKTVRAVVAGKGAY